MQCWCEIKLHLCMLMLMRQIFHLAGSPVAYVTSLNQSPAVMWHSAVRYLKYCSPSLGTALVQWLWRKGWSLEKEALEALNHGHHISLLSSCSLALKQTPACHISSSHTSPFLLIVPYYVFIDCLRVVAGSVLGASVVHIILQTKF